MKIVCTLLLAMSALGTAAVAATTPSREIVVAQIAGFSGSRAERGKAMHAGIKLYFDKVNADGGVNGARIKLIAKDDAYKPEQTVRLVKETIAAERPVAFIGATGTANVEALIKERVLSDANTPLVGVSGATTMVGAQNVFTVKATYHDEADKLFEILVSTGVKSVSVVYQDDPSGADVLAGLEKASARTGVRIAEKASFPRDTTDLKAEAKRLMQANPPFIYLAAPTAGAIAFIKEYRELGGAAQIYGISTIDGPLLGAKLGSTARGFAWATVVPPVNAKGFAIVREYQELAARSKDPDLGAVSLEGYIAAKVLVHAMRKAKTLTPAAVARALAATGRLDLGDYIVDYSDAKRAGAHFVDFAIVNGQGQIVH